MKKNLNRYKNINKERKWKIWDFEKFKTKKQLPSEVNFSKIWNFKRFKPKNFHKKCKKKKIGKRRKMKKNLDRDIKKEKKE